MMDVRRSVRAKLSLMFISILFVACTLAFVVVTLAGLAFFRSGAQDINTMHRIMLPAALFLCVLFGSMLMFHASRLVTRPVRLISQSAREVARGNFELQVDYHSRDELGQLAENFNRMTRELQTMAYMRKDFVSQVSHEFRTPMASLTGYAELLCRPELTEEARLTYAHIMMTETRRLNRLAENLLRLSRLDHQAIAGPQKPFRLDEQIRRVMVLLADAWGRKEIQPEMRLLPRVWQGDEELLMQVWINLLDNAIRYSPRAGVLTLEMKEGDGRLWIEILDEGPGIPQDDTERIFERFYRPAREVAGDGNGLGLAIVRSICQLCGGGVTAENRPSGGACFRVWLPADEVVDSGNPR